MGFFHRCRLAAPFLLLAFAPPASPQVDTLVRSVEAEVRPGDTVERMTRLWDTDRWFNFAKFRETAEYLDGTLKAIGLRNVELVAPLADGVAQYGYWTMPLAWDVNQATLEIVEPAGAPPDMRMLADYRKIPTSLGMWSSATPPGGITAEVAELKDLTAAAIAKANLKGKLVLVWRDPSDMKPPLVRAGAIGTISAWSENPNLRNAHFWINGWGDHGWGYTKTSTPLLSFSVSPRQGEYLSGLVARGVTVRVKANVDTRYYAGSYPYVTGMIPGASDEEVLVLGHTSEQGANDNATGVSVMIEAMATLQRLIASGRLKPPRRAIRILAMPEMYGSMHYVVTNPERMKRTMAAICVDAFAGPYDEAGSEVKIVLNPDVARSYADALLLRIANSYFGRRRLWSWEGSGLGPDGTDTFLYDPLIGNIPTFWLTAGNPIDVHHNSEDTPVRADARSMRDLVILTASYLYYIAAAGDQQIPWLAEITASRGYENIVRTAQPSLDRAAAATRAEDLARELRDGAERIAYCAARDQDAVLMTLRLTNPAGREKMRAALAPVLDKLQKFAGEQSGRLADAANRRAAELGLPVPVKPAAAAQDPRLAEAARMIVKRKRAGTITLDDLPEDQREGQPSAAWNATLITALNWCDGKRNLAEVIRLTRLERGTLRNDLVAWFRFLAKHGYVEIVE